MGGVASAVVGGHPDLVAGRRWRPPVASRRARRAVVAAALVPPLVDWWQGRAVARPGALPALRLLDDLAYGAGVWDGCRRARTIEPLVPDLRSWPGRRPAVEPG